MKKIAFLGLFFLGISTALHAQGFVATGLNNPAEKWYNFEARAATVIVENYGAFTQVEIQSRNRMVCKDYYPPICPSSQPFQVKIPFHLPEGAVVTSAGVLQNQQWIDAKAVDLLRAEEIYNQAPKSDQRLLLRRRLKRNSDGKAQSDYVLLLSPIYNSQDFVFRIKYVIHNSPGLWMMRTQLKFRDLLAACPLYSHCNMPIRFYFIDRDFPDYQPSFYMGLQKPERYTFVKHDGWWTIDVPRKYLGYHYYYYSSLPDAGIQWFRPLSNGPELRLFENEDGKFYSLMLAPPLQPAERTPRRVLILYDLGNEVAGAYLRSQLLSEFKLMASSGLNDQDSINVLLTDFVPKTLRQRFIPATNENVDQLFSEIKQAPQPHLSTLPQLLRAAKDYFNGLDVSGEVWIISSAIKYSKPISVANEIIDLSWRQLKNPVSFRIFDCSRSSWSYRVQVNGTTYYGNDYLYENLARLSRGAFVKAENVQPWQLLDVLANSFFPAVDAVEVDVFPQGGFHESRFLLNGGRSHFPIAWPYTELGRYTGDLPFSVDYFGKVDGNLYKHKISLNSTFNTPHSDLVATMWQAYHVENLMKGPQSYATIAEIARVSTKYHFLSSYNGFVIPGPSGLMGFKRLVEVDTTQTEQQASETLPIKFEMSAFPNPFNLSTVVQMTFPALEKAKTAQVKIYDLLGKLVRTDRFNVPKGTTSVQFHWDGHANNQVPLPSGVYLISGRVGRFHQLVKVTLLK